MSIVVAAHDFVFTINAEAYLADRVGLVSLELLVNEMKRSNDPYIGQVACLTWKGKMAHMGDSGKVVEGVGPCAPLTSSPEINFTHLLRHQPSSVLLGSFKRQAKHISMYFILSFTHASSHPILLPPAHGPTSQPPRQLWRPLTFVCQAITSVFSRLDSIAKFHRDLLEAF